LEIGLLRIMFGSPALLERRQPAHTHGATVGQPALSEELVALSRVPAQAACTECASCVEGLDQAEAERRLAYFGPNLITREKKPTILRELVGRAKNPLNALLLALAIVSYFLGDIRAAAVIAIMILLAVTTAFIQEHRSNEAAAKLRALVKTTASVKRKTGNTAEFTEIPIETLVPGDIVRLSAGDMIPGDLRLIEAKDLFVNQSALTGEAMPAEKFAHAFNVPCGNAFDLSNICFMGANVVSGFATGVIVHTGPRPFLDNWPTRSPVGAYQRRSIGV
jgi:Mg2+-importing ATPase